MSSTAVSEVASEVAPTEITTEPVAQTASPEEDEIYNCGMMSGLGIDQEDARKAAAYLSGISYGRIVSAEILELTDKTYVELRNNEQIVIYLYLLSDGNIKEITDFNLHTLITISDESDSSTLSNKSTQSENNGSTGSGTNSESSDIQNYDSTDDGSGDLIWVETEVSFW